MAYKPVCDRCGEIISKPWHCFFYAHNLPGRSRPANSTQIDLCEKCADGFVDFMRRPAEQADEEGE